MPRRHPGHDSNRGKCDNEYLVQPDLESRDAPTPDGSVADAGINAGVDNPNNCSSFVLMEVETLGVARSLGWKVHMRCTDGYRESTRSMRRCVYRKQLDLETLVSTRGPNFPLSPLETRLMCPA
jgi:hypothetical protein